MPDSATPRINKQVKLHSFGSRNSPLVIDVETISFKGKQLRIKEINGILYWVSPVVFYHYMIGRRYHIGFRTPDDQLDIVFRSFFGFSKKYFKKLCNKILDAVWEPVTDNILQQAMDALRAGKIADFEHCQVSAEGVYLCRKQHLITWDDLAYDKMYNRLVLNSKTDHAVFTNLELSKCWNVDVLITLLDWLTEQGGLKEIQQTGAKPNTATL